MVKIDREIMAKIIVKSWKDKAFKNKLQNQPKEALKEFGVDLSDDIELVTIFHPHKKVPLLIPDTPIGVKEISEKELEKLAGGCIIGSWGYFSAGEAECQSALGCGGQ